MCGRFTLTLHADALESLFEADALPPVPRYNIFPTQRIAVVVAHENARVIAPMRWGFVPHW